MCVVLHQYIVTPLVAWYVQDKGVQDGRRPQIADTEDSPSSEAAPIGVAAPISVAPVPTIAPLPADAVQSRAGGEAGNVAALRIICPGEIPHGYDISSPVRVNLKIDKEHTSDGEGREVEFMFNPESDNYKVKSGRQEYLSIL